MKKTLIVFIVSLTITGVGCGSSDSGEPALLCTLTVEPCNGNVTSSPEGIDCGSGAGETSCTSSFDCGATVTLTATPATGYTLVGWSGEDCPSQYCSSTCADACTACTVTMDADKTCSATFTSF